MTQIKIELNISELITENFPKAKIKYLEKYNSFESDCHLLFEFLSGNLGTSVPSESVDEIWHWMILYTQKYGKFCQEHFGRFVHHIPSDKKCSCDTADTEWNCSCDRGTKR
jgi:hypothetical protein